MIYYYLVDILAYARSLEITDKAAKSLEKTVERKKVLDCRKSSTAVNAIRNRQEKLSQYHE
jgi:hypothetical protein